jgi:hypothetical protein
VAVNGVMVAVQVIGRSAGDLDETFALRDQFPPDVARIEPVVTRQPVLEGIEPAVAPDQRGNLRRPSSK